MTSCDELVRMGALRTLQNNIAHSLQYNNLYLMSYNVLTVDTHITVTFYSIVASNIPGITKY